MSSSSQSQEPENLKERIKASYDAIAPTYNAWTADHSPKRVEYINQLVDLLRPSETAGQDLPTLRVLELGCGAGRPATELLLTALAPVHVTANDLSAAQIQLAKETLGEHGEKVKGTAGKPDSTVDWVQGDMMALEFPDATAEGGGLDAVTGFFSIIHLPLNEQVELLGRIARWLRPGGYLLANFAERAADSIVSEHWLHEKGWMFWSGWGVEGTEKKIREAGLEMVVGKVEKDDVDANFFWVIARKPQ